MSLSAELCAAEPAVLATQDERVAGEEEAAPRAEGVTGEEVNFVRVMMQTCQQCHFDFRM